MAPRKTLAHRLLGLCVQYAQPLSFVLYLSAAGGFLLLPHAGKRNYLDENALLAGFANSQIRLIPRLILCPIHTQGEIKQFSAIFQKPCAFVNLSVLGS